MTKRTILTISILLTLALSACAGQLPAQPSATRAAITVVEPANQSLTATVPAATATWVMITASNPQLW